MSIMPAANRGPFVRFRTAAFIISLARADVLNIVPEAVEGTLCLGSEPIARARWRAASVIYAGSSAENRVLGLPALPISLS